LAQAAIQSDMNIPVAPLDTQPPTAPANLTATNSTLQVALTWTASTDNVGVTQYNVYRSTTSGFTANASSKIGVSTTTSYNDNVAAAPTITS